MNKALKVVLAGVLLFGCGVVLGICGTLVGMVGTFSQIANSDTVSPGQVARGVSSSFLFTAIGGSIAVAGICLAVGGLIAWLGGRR